MLDTPKTSVRPRGGPSVQVSDEKYSAALASEGGAPVVQLKGTISTANPAQILNPFVDAAHKELSAAAVKHIDVDLRDLEFCNSSGFKSFIYWIQLIQKLPQPQQYKLRFKTNPQRRWQKTSLLALSCFAVELTEIVSA